MSEASALPSDAVLVHIGPYKTGTTTIQSALFAAKPRLAEHGVVYPGKWRRIVSAGYSVMRWSPRGRTIPGPEMWDGFAARMRARSDERVCISTEDFSRISSSETAGKIVRDLGSDRVHVLYVARSFDRLLPSAWQERVKGHDEREYEEWLHSVLPAPKAKKDAAYRAFWRPHDLEAKAKVWLPHVGRDRFHVLIADDSDHDHLLRRFEELLGLPHYFLEQQSSDNESLSVVRLEVLRRLNRRFREEEWPDLLYYQLIQSGLIRGLQSAPRTDVDLRPPALPSWAVDRVRARSDERIAAIERLGLSVIGDPERLRLPADYRAADVHRRAEELVPTDAVVEGVSAMITAVLRRDAEQQPRPTDSGLSPQLTGIPSRTMLAEIVRRQRRRVRRIARRARRARRRRTSLHPTTIRTDRQRHEDDQQDSHPAESPQDVAAGCSAGEE